MSFAKTESRGIAGSDAPSGTEHVRPEAPGSARDTRSQAPVAELQLQSDATPIAEIPAGEESASFTDKGLSERGGSSTTATRMPGTPSSNLRVKNKSPASSLSHECSIQGE